MMSRRIIPLATILFLIWHCGQAQLYKCKNFTEEHSFTAEVEGPAVDANGYLYAVSFHHKTTIGKITPAGEGSIFLEMPEGSTANGIRFNRDGTMFVADYTGHNILRIRDGKVSVFVHEPTMNQPNDLAITDDGTLFASDPDWKNETGKLWKISTDGKVKLLEDNMGTTNGVEVSPDQKYLYVNESKQKNIWIYDLDKKGNVSNKRLFYKIKENGETDGMRTDIRGNLYVALYDMGKVLIISPQGNLLRTVKTNGKRPTNLAFGGDDGRTVYVTIADKGNINVFRTEHPGRSWKLRQGN
ncbi:SMP-30/gluconolactonase/LRE family protein [Fulvivirgaceae bacterium BMA10]|uniref:SMP-30/gluconolactonase/LRE family protein n=1 Tax=Splendidivirga corallicola TaxID=3051826 RepID=A0ABT8KPA4_9BACT|nr:SMP-30/gluconolactonase/LRE family protein [Fulvivirgaceae bacterium BMA10]